MRIAGAVLILLGFTALLIGGIPYKKTENVAQIGDLKMQVTEKHEYSIPPVVSGLAILAGAVMMFAGGRKRGV
jgi:hypothetical protein